MLGNTCHISLTVPVKRVLHQQLRSSSVVLVDEIGMMGVDEKQDCYTGRNAAAELSSGRRI
jgi:hypothetical protein